MLVLDVIFNLDLPPPQLFHLGLHLPDSRGLAPLLGLLEPLLALQLSQRRLSHGGVGLRRLQVTLERGQPILEGPLKVLQVCDPVKYE